MTQEQLFALIPDEHKMMINGELCLSEMGIIHLTTLVEQHDPSKAKRAREFRYAVSKHCAEHKSSK